MPAGLTIAGEVLGRKRKEFKSEGRPLRYLITFTILAASVTHRVDAWCEQKQPDWLPAVGTKIAWPVDVRTFTTARGAQTSLVKIDAEGDESF